MNFRLRFRNADNLNNSVVRTFSVLKDPNTCTCPVADPGFPVGEAWTS